MCVCVTLHCDDGSTVEALDDSATWFNGSDSGVLGIQTWMLRCLRSRKPVEAGEAGSVTGRLKVGVSAHCSGNILLGDNMACGVCCCSGVCCLGVRGIGTSTAGITSIINAASVAGILNI